MKVNVPTLEAAGSPYTARRGSPSSAALRVPATAAAVPAKCLSSRTSIRSADM